MRYIGLETIFAHGNNTCWGGKVAIPYKMIWFRIDSDLCHRVHQQSLPPRIKSHHKIFLYIYFTLLAIWTFLEWKTTPIDVEDLLVMMAIDEWLHEYLHDVFFRPKIYSRNLISPLNIVWQLWLVGECVWSMRSSKNTINKNHYINFIWICCTKNIKIIKTASCIFQ